MKNPFRVRRTPEEQAAYDRAYKAETEKIKQAKQKAKIERAEEAGRRKAQSKGKNLFNKMADIGDNVLGSGFFDEPTPRKRKRKKKTNAWSLV